MARTTTDAQASGRIHVLERSQTIRRPLDEVFPFFCDPHNLAEITPAFVHFSILTPRSPMARGTLIDYQLRLLGVPFRWRTQIVEFDPPSRFVDVQLTGPYALWEHAHEFVPTADGTRMGDRVRYALPLGPLGRLAHVLFVARTLDRIFDYRRTRIEEIFA